MSNIENITFGVEIETTIPATALIEVGGYHHGSPVVSAVILNHSAPALLSPRTPAPQFNGATWKAERDCSIQVEARGHVPCEFVSPILKGEAGVRHLLDFVAFLNAIGAKVNRSTGLHVHVGVGSFANLNDLSNAETSTLAQAKFVKILARLVTRNATALYAQTGTLSREQGSFCKKLSSADARKAISKACRKKNAANLLYTSPTADRYQLLNLTNVATKHTVEFRCFAGTTNASKILCHLLSVFLLCKVAAGRKSLTNWDPTEELSGMDALNNLLKSRPTFKIVEASVFAEHKEALLKAGFEMAQKYDEAKAAARQVVPPTPSTIPAVVPPLTREQVARAARDCAARARAQGIL